MNIKRKKDQQSEAIERKIEEFLSAGGKITNVPDGMINAPTHMNQNDYYSKMNKIDGDRKKYLSLNPRRR